MYTYITFVSIVICMLAVCCSVYILTHILHVYTYILTHILHVYIYQICIYSYMYVTQVYNAYQHSFQCVIYIDCSPNLHTTHIAMNTGTFTRVEYSHI